MGDEARRAPRRRHQRRRRPGPWDVGCGLFGWYRQLAVSGAAPVAVEVGDDLRPPSRLQSIASPCQLEPLASYFARSGERLLTLHDHVVCRDVCSP
jgi:hypothetical protein